MKKRLVPTDYYDWLAIISFIGYLGIVLQYLFGINFINDRSTSIFLIFAGVGLLFIGNVFEIKQWVGNGIQKGETIQILAIVIGLMALVVGILLIFGVTLGAKFQGFVGIIAIFPAVFIAADYFIKNRGIF